ncbi:Cell division control protein 3 [Gurleya vavrai]
MNFPGIGISHLPNQRYRMFCKRGIDFNIMVIGPNGSGKSSFLNMLLKKNIIEVEPYKQISNKNIDCVKYRKTEHPYSILNENDSKESSSYIDLKNSIVNFQVTNCVFIDTKFKVRMSITEVDGIGDRLDNEKCWEPITAHINELFVDFYMQERENVRAFCTDRRIHACLYFIEAHSETPSDLDLEIMREVSHYCNVIPVVSKSDILTEMEINSRFENICNKLDSENIHIFEPSNENTDKVNRPPYFIICGHSPNEASIELRSCLHGIIDVENNEENDFNEVSKVLIEKNMVNLIESTETFYESYRTKELTNDFVSGAHLSEDEVKISKDFIEKLKEEERKIMSAKEKYLSRKSELENDLKDHEGLYTKNHK